ncbi:MAG TPA: oligosaccharide flippase family protein, partial [Candidatus Paceibacterota bacterium]|nr:oligosaccharide flippase family protein [Candidatus Paceibacterota bacterium]
MQTLIDRLHGLLRRSERYTKTDMVYAVSGLFWTTSGQAVAILCAIPLAVVLANLLTPVEYGIYRYVLTVAAVIGAFSLTGLPAVLTRAAARGFDGSLKEAFWLTIKGSGLVILGSFAGAAYYYLQGNSILAGGMALIGIFWPWLQSATLFSAFLSGKLLVRMNTAYGNRRTVIHTLVMLATAYLYPEPLAILLSYFVIQTATALYYYHKTRKLHVENDERDPELKFLGKHMSFLNIINVLIDKLDALLLFQFVGAAELAIYAFAEMVPDVLNRFTKNVSALALPKFVTRGDAAGIWRKTFLISLLLLPVALLYCALAPFLFPIFLPAYTAAVPFTQALALLAVINAALPSTYIDAQGAIKTRYVITFVTNITKVIAVG